MNDSVPQPHEGPNSKARVKDALLATRRELIDLTRRNRLLSTTRTGGRPPCLEIVGANLDDLFVALTREDKHFVFLAFAERLAEESMTASGEVLSVVRASNSNGLQTKLDPEKL